MAIITFQVDVQETLSKARVLEFKTVEINHLERKALALQLARKHFGQNIRLETFDDCFEIHDRGPVVRPCVTHLGTVWTSEAHTGRATFQADDMVYLDELHGARYIVKEIKPDSTAVLIPVGLNAMASFPVPLSRLIPVGADDTD